MKQLLQDTVTEGPAVPTSQDGSISIQGLGLDLKQGKSLEDDLAAVSVVLCIFGTPFDSICPVGWLSSGRPSCTCQPFMYEIQEQT
jgi:hypothetical protein